MTSLFERLNDNEIILLDGGVSTEIQKRGVAMDSDVWSGLAHKSHPEVVLQVHEDYIRAGAQVITANTYSTARHVLESIDLGGEVRAINTEAVQLAKEARDNSAKHETWIAGSMSSMAPFNSPQEVAAGEKVAQNYQELAEIIAEAGKIKSAANLAECRMASFWTRIESELLLEGKTLVCVFEDKRLSVSVVCRDNHLYRKYNRVKELYPVAKDGFRINTELGAGSPYFELRCYF